MSHRFVKNGVFLLALLTVPMAFADVLGVSDAAMLANAVKQLEQLKTQYSLLKNSYDTAKSA
jgi:type IV secretion system protein VirB5